jgi:release factor glutamine methyltransferase
LTFEVSPAVLIPRPVTEELVHKIIREFMALSKSPASILDIGTGSGCIAVTLAKKLTETQVYAIDISEDALQIAKQNAQRNQVKIHFLQADILSSDLPALPPLDLIVSNPPYVTNREKAALASNVLDYEPHQALFADDDDPVLFYRRMAEIGWDKLVENGLLYFEINPLCSEMIGRMLHEKGFRQIEIMRDLSGKERFIKATK